MNYILSVFVILLLVTAGCSTTSSDIAVTPDQTVTIPSSEPSVAKTIQQTIVTTSSPVILPPPTTDIPDTSIPTLGPLKTIRDSELWFTMQVPESWVVTTSQLSIPEGYSGISFDTSLYNKNKFHIFTYGITHQDQDRDLQYYYRRSWTPYPNETKVVINGITFDRYESKSDGNISVAYSVKQGSGNERGYASVIEYAISSDSQYRQRDFEFIISTFRYLSARDIGSAPGEEVKH